MWAFGGRNISSVSLNTMLDLSAFGGLTTALTNTQQACVSLSDVCVLCVVVLMCRKAPDCEMAFSRDSSAKCNVRERTRSTSDVVF